MAIQILKRPASWFLALILLILVTDITMLRVFSSAHDEQILAYSVLFDFMLTIPFLYWFCVLRRKGKSLAKILPMPLLGALAAWLVFPAEMRSHIWNAVWPVEMLLAGAEIVFVGYELRLLYRLYRRFSHIARQEENTGEALRMAVHETMGKGKFASLVLHDVGITYYLLFSWRRKPAADRDGTYQFTYHRKNSQLLYAAIYTKVLVVKGFLFTCWFRCGLTGRRGYCPRAVCGCWL